MRNLSCLCRPVLCRAPAARKAPPCSRCRTFLSHPEAHAERATQAFARPALWSCGLARMTCRLPHTCSSTAHLSREPVCAITPAANSEPLSYRIPPAWQAIPLWHQNVHGISTGRVAQAHTSHRTRQILGVWGRLRLSRRTGIQGCHCTGTDSPALSCMRPCTACTCRGHIL